MNTRFIGRLAVTLGAVAVLAVGLGFTPLTSASTPAAHAATLAQPDASRNGPHNNSNGSGGIRIDPGHGNGRNSGQGNHIVQTGGGPAHSIRHLQHVPSSYHFFYGPYHTYQYDWYFTRHLSFPHLYRVFEYEPVSVCFAEYYFHEGVFYCFVG